MTESQNKFPPFAVLPNGKSLTVQWYSFRNQSLTPKMTHSIADPSQTQKPELILFQKGLSAACADFDILPDPFEDWDQLERFLEYRIGHIGIVYRSRSERVKILFVIDPQGLKPELIAGDSVLKVLEQAFDDEGCNWRACLDMNAFEHTFITPSLQSKIHRLPLLTPIETVFDSAEPRAWTAYNREFSDTAKLALSGVSGGLKGKSSANFEALIRLLVSTPQLLDSFDLPTTVLAREVSRITKASISDVQILRWIQRLEEKGWLKCIDQDSKRGVKAKTYCARGELAVLIDSARHHGNTQHIVRPLPDIIKDGSGKDAIFEAGAHFVETARQDFSLALSRFKNWVRRATKNPAKLSERLNRCSGVLKFWLGTSTRYEEPLEEPMSPAFVYDLNRASEYIGDAIITPLAV